LGTSKHYHLREQKILELATGTGILSIFLKMKGLDITSSDYNDESIEKNVRFNASLNGVEFPHIPYTWGESLPISMTNTVFDVIFANDCLIYDKQYDNLATSVKMLLQCDVERRSKFYLSSKRKLKVKPTFFEVLDKHNFVTTLVGPRIWELKLGI